MLCALVLACATALGGCSVVDWKPWGRQGPEQGAIQERAQASPEGEAHASQADPDAERGGGAAAAGGAADDTPGWNLQTLASTVTASGLNALTLERAWRLAVENDPDYRAAISGRAAAQTEIRLGRAAILPQVQAGYSRSKITGLQRNYPTGVVREADLDYDSTSAYIQLQQPVFNIDRYAQFQRGYARAELGDAEFALAEYEAAMRLIAAYVDTVAAQGRSELAHALADSLDEQARTQDALFERNEASRVDAQETRARLAIARADVIAAEDELAVARRQLQALIGEAPDALTGLDNVHPDEAGRGEPLMRWLEVAEANGAAIRTAAARVRVADTEVRRAVARHLPSADLVVGLSDADSENLDSLSQRSNTFTVGLRVAIPIFSGGYDTANHARTRHERQQAEHELAQAREELAAEITRHYTAVEGGAQRIAALIASVESGEQSLEAARKGYEYGVNSNLDVLRRQDSLFEARHELLSARVTWLEARVALATAAGTPVSAVFMEMDALLRQR